MKITLLHTILLVGLSTACMAQKAAAPTAGEPTNDAEAAAKKAKP